MSMPFVDEQLDAILASVPDDWHGGEERVPLPTNDHTWDDTLSYLLGALSKAERTGLAFLLRHNDPAWAMQSQLDPDVQPSIALVEAWVAAARLQRYAADHRDDGPTPSEERGA